MTERKLNLDKFASNAVQMKKEQLKDVKGGHKRIPVADDSVSIINWDNIDVRSNGELTNDREAIGGLRRNVLS